MGGKDSSDHNFPHHDGAGLSLHEVNLNLLPVLRAVLRAQSVSGAAEALGLSQPAVSMALARLRLSLNDPLLVQAGRRMELTKRARELIQPVEKACDAIELIWTNESFQPQSINRTFLIASADHGPLILAPPLLRALKTEAPGVSLHFVDFTLELLTKPHGRGAAFLIAPRSVFDGIEHHELRVVQFTPPEDFVVVVGSNHRLATKAMLTPSDLENEREAIFHPGPSRAQELSDAIGGYQPGRVVVGRFQQFTILPVLAMLTDVITIVPRGVANRMAQVLDIRIFDDPTPAPPTELCLAWSLLYESDPAHQWLRDLILRVVAEERLI